MHSRKNGLRGTIFCPPLKTLATLRQRFWRWQWSERRARKMRHFYAQFIQPGDLVFDVGANMGSRTRVFLELGAKVVAVEPQKKCVRILFLTFHANPNFHLVNKALGAAEGKGEMYISNISLTTSLSRVWIQAVKPDRYRGITWPTSQQVSVTTLDALIQEYGIPSYVKIDAECFEHEILRGLSSPLLALSLEFLPAYLEPALQSIAYLKRFDPIRLNYTLGERFTWMLKEWVTPDEMISILETYRTSEEFKDGEVYARLMNTRSPRTDREGIWRII
jgi:FkbM family methyltransferase